MNKQFRLSVISIGLVIAIPFIAIGKDNGYLQEKSENYAQAVSYQSKPNNSETDNTTPDNNISGIDSEICIFNHLTNETENILMSDYIKGVVCAEIPYSYSDEAIKAQAVIAHTYALRIIAGELKSPTESLKGGVISTDPNVHQSYYSKEQIKELYKDDYEQKYSRISNLVDSVFNKVITYEDEPIIAAFHAISSGSTESSENVWGQNVAYLVPAESSEDISSPNYESSVTFTLQEVKNILYQNYPDIIFTSDKENWITISEYTSSGYVKTVNVLNKTLSGQQFRSIFSLKSACFEVSFNDDTFTITTKGYGHGVGLSQYGANAMANEGKTYEEIIAHYYPNTVIENIA